MAQSLPPERKEVNYVRGYQIFLSQISMWTLVAAILAATACLAAPHHGGAPARDAVNVDVVIIGAGMAGVAAAGVLASHPAGLSFVVLEASNRTGGRVVSRTFGNPSVATAQIEVGANWIHGTDPPATSATTSCTTQTARWRPPPPSRRPATTLPARTRAPTPRRRP